MEADRPPRYCRLNMAINMSLFHTPFLIHVLDLTSRGDVPLCILRPQHTWRSYFRTHSAAASELNAQAANVFNLANNRTKRTGPLVDIAVQAFHRMRYELLDVSTI